MVESLLNLQLTMVSVLILLTKQAAMSKLLQVCKAACMLSSLINAHWQDTQHYIVQWATRLPMITA